METDKMMEAMEEGQAHRLVATQEVAQMSGIYMETTMKEEEGALLFSDQAIRQDIIKELDKVPFLDQESVQVDMCMFY